MIETEDYWITENKFIFKPKFNECVDKYKDLIKLYDVLIFSNYNQINFCIEQNNLHDTLYTYNYEHSKFNREVSLPLNLTNLIFGHKFNQEVELPCFLTHLSFGDAFNRVVLLPTNLTLLIFGYSFNQPVELPISLTYLTFGTRFNQKVNIPLKIKYLKLHCNNLYLIENLPNSIEELELGLNFNLELNNLPNSIRIIKFYHDSHYNKDLNNLVNSIKILQLPEYYGKKIKNIPCGLKKIILSRDYAYIDDFKEYEVETY